MALPSDRLSAKRRTRRNAEVKFVMVLLAGGLVYGL